MEKQRQIYIATIVGSMSNVLLLALKLVAGIVSNSAAMIADAVHSISDFATDVVVLLFVKISGKPRDCDHQYGHGKYETLATAIIGIALMMVAIGLFWSGAEKIWRFSHGEVLPVPGMLALVAALVSIVVKELLYQYTAGVGKKVNSQVVIANAWHHRSDAFSSIATAVGIGGAILLGSKWAVLDPIAAVMVSLLILRVAFTLFVPSINELLEKSLPQATELEILRIIRSFDQVSEPHNLRTRRIGPVASIEVHIRMNGDMTVRDSHEVTKQIEQRIRTLLGEDTLINTHVEPTAKYEG